VKHQDADIDLAAMQCYLRRGHRERSKATWELLGALSRGVSNIVRRLTGTGTFGGDAALTR